LGVLQRGVVEVCSASGYELLVHPLDAEAPDLPEAIAAFVRRSRVDGLLLLSPISENGKIPAALVELGVPAVALAAIRVPGYPAMLVSDEVSAGRGMAAHLIGLGHRRIAMITGPLRYFSARERQRGFLQAMDAAHLPVPPEYIVEGDYRFASGLAAAERLLSLAERPTAIFASNDIMAAAVLKVAAERGLQTPRDLSVAGYDDSDIATMVTPSLTTIRRPLEEMASAAASQLLALISGDPPGPDQKVALTLVTRASTAPPAGSPSRR
jgi:LacI family transcriptional regulator